jgi:hypothetical protein
MSLPLNRNKKDTTVVEMTITNENKKCADLVVGKKNDRLEQLHDMWEAYCDPDNDDNYTEDGENIYEFGLSFDYVEPDTWDDQPEGYWQYQLSYGGPSDEFRFHDDGRIEYRYHDWFDGAGRVLMGEEYTFMEQLAEQFFGLTHKQKWEQEW